MVKKKVGTNVVTGGEIFRLAACSMLNLACNILAPFFSPLAGVLFAAGGVVCWLLSLGQAASIRKRLAERPVVAAIVIVALIVFAIWTTRDSFHAYRRVFSEYQQLPCHAGPATATGIGNTAVSGCGNKVSTGKGK